MNRVEIQAKVRCSGDQAERMVGRVEHVEFLAGDVANDGHGIATMRLTLLVIDDPNLTLPACTRTAMLRIEEALTEADIDSASLFDLAIRSESLIKVDGMWRTRGEIVHA